MKRAVFISVLSLLGLQSPGNLSSGYTYLTSIIHCDALCVTSKVISTIKLSGPDRPNGVQYIVSPLNSKHQNMPVASVKTPVTLLPKEPTIKSGSRSIGPTRRKTKRSKHFLFNSFNNDIKVPP